MDDDNISYHPSSKNINTETYFATRMSNRSRKIQSGLKSFKKPPPLLSTESPLNSGIKKSPNMKGIKHNIEQLSLKRRLINEGDFLYSKQTSIKQFKKSNWLHENSKIQKISHSAQPFSYHKKHSMIFYQSSDPRDNLKTKSLLTVVKSFSLENSPISTTKYDQNQIDDVVIGSYSPNIIYNNQVSKEYKTTLKSAEKKLDLNTPKDYINFQLSPHVKEFLQDIQIDKKAKIDNSFLETSSFFRERSRTIQPPTFGLCGPNHIYESQNLSLMDGNKIITDHLQRNSFHLFDGKLNAQEISAIELLNNSNIEKTRFTLGNVSPDQIKAKDLKNDLYISGGTYGYDGRLAVAIGDRNLDPSYDIEEKKDHVFQLLNNNSMNLQEEVKEEENFSKSTLLDFGTISDRKFDLPLQILPKTNLNHEMIKMANIESHSFHQNETRHSTRLDDTINQVITNNNIGNHIDSTYFLKNLPSSRPYISLREQSSTKDFRQSCDHIQLSDNFHTQNFDSVQGIQSRQENLQVDLTKSVSKISKDSSRNHSHEDNSVNTSLVQKNNHNEENTAINTSLTKKTEKVSIKKINFITNTTDLMMNNTSLADIKVNNSFDLTSDIKELKNSNFSINLSLRGNSLVKTSSSTSLCSDKKVNKSIHKNSLEKSSNSMTDDRNSSQEKVKFPPRSFNRSEDQSINESHSEQEQQNLGNF